MKMNIGQRIGNFERNLGTLGDKANSQFVIDLVQEIAVKIDDLGERIYDHMDQEARDTWGWIEGTCYFILEAFTPKHDADNDILLMLLMDSRSINLRLNAIFKKEMKSLHDKTNV
jgi:hypothetical protein